MCLYLAVCSSPSSSILCAFFYGSSFLSMGPHFFYGSSFFLRVLIISVGPHFFYGSIFFLWVLIFLPYWYNLLNLAYCRKMYNIIKWKYILVCVTSDEGLQTFVSTLRCSVTRSVISDRSNPRSSFLDYEVIRYLVQCDKKRQIFF